MKRLQTNTAMNALKAEGNSDGIVAILDYSDQID